MPLALMLRAQLGSQHLEIQNFRQNRLGNHLRMDPPRKGHLVRCHRELGSAFHLSSIPTKTKGLLSQKVGIGQVERVQGAQVTGWMYAGIARAPSEAPQVQFHIFRPKG